jgi:hemolysin-activating ACP:hemolysin acyltransferase
MLIDHNKAIVDGLYLFQKSKWHVDYNVNDVHRYLVAPVKHNRIRIYYAGKEPIGLITWCWLSKEAAKKFLNFDYYISEEDYVKDFGEELWGIEFIAPYGDAKTIMKLNRKEYKETYPDRNEKVHWRRLSDPTKRHTKKV